MLCSTSARAFWPADADTSFNAYNNAFYSAGNGNAFYKMDNGTGTGPGWWSFAEEIEMAEDVYGRTGASGTRDLITALCNGFTANRGSSWTYNNYNDDITWAVIAFLRAYQITGNANFRNIAKTNFDAMYARGWDNSLGGGIWWSTDKSCKNACINGPASIAAYLLYQTYNDSSYLTKAQNIYNWERSKLFNPNTGEVYDNLSASGVLTTWVFTYNMGTFIGAANYLGQTGDAQSAANTTRDKLCNNGGLFPNSGTGGDGGGFNGIFLRWMVKYMNDRGVQSSYLPWLQLNANAAWNVRRTADNLSWCNWDSATPSGTLASFDCVNSLVALQTIPADGEGITLYTGGSYGGRPGQLLGTGSFTLAQLTAKGVANDSVSSVRVPAGWQVTLYTDDNFGGASYTFGQNATAMPGGFDRSASSCKIQTTGAIFYQSASYGGARGQALAKGSYTLSQLQANGVQNDWASSVRIPPGWTIIAYQDDNFQGNSWTYTADTSIFSSAATSQMSSCKVLGPYGTWQTAHFSAAELANPAVGGDGADPDGDGITNLLEYALNLDPRTAGTQGLPTVGGTAVGGGQYLTLTYRQVIGAADISYVPQVSGDLVNWNAGTGYLAPVSTTPNTDGLTQTVVVRDLTPINGANRRFARLLVTRP